MSFFFLVFFFFLKNKGTKRVGIINDAFNLINKYVDASRRAEVSSIFSYIEQNYDQKTLNMSIVEDFLKKQTDTTLISHSIEKEMMDLLSRPTGR